MPPRFNVAVKQARLLLARAEVVAAPVPIEDIAKLVGAAVRREPFDGRLSGMVHRGPDGRAVIGVNDSDVPERQRFTIAHELGHLLLHRSEGFHIDEGFVAFRSDLSSRAEDDREIEANQFAAELLMPEAFLRRDIGDRRFDAQHDDAIAGLATAYGVSPQAMTIRLSRFGFLR